MKLKTNLRAQLILVILLIWSDAMVGFCADGSRNAPLLIQEKDKTIRKEVLQKFELSGTQYTGGLGIVTFIPNAVHSRHQHTGPEVVYVLEGKVTILADHESPKVYEAGTSWHMPAGVFHSTTAGPQGAKVLVTWIFKSE